MNKSICVWIGFEDAAGISIANLTDYTELVIACGEPWRNTCRDDRTKGVQTTKVVQSYIADFAGVATLFCYNLADFNALSQATGLLDLYPGLQETERKQIEVIDVKDLIDSVELCPKQQHQLVLNVPDKAAELLDSISKAKPLHLFTTILVRVGQKALYKDAISAAELTNWMSQQGFNLVFTDTSDPDLSFLKFQRNQQTSLAFQHETTQRDIEKQLLQALDAITTQKADLESMRSKIDNQELLLARRAQDIDNLQTLNQQLEWTLTLEKREKEKLSFLNESLRQTYQELLTQSNIQLKELSAQLIALTQQEKEGRDKLHDVLSKQVEATGTLQKSQGTLISVCNTIKENQAQITVNTDKAMLNGVKQIEAFISLNQLIETGRLPLNYHGWPISADMALFLARKVVTEHFDYIIEFGSGTSTVIFAQALQARQKKSAVHANSKVISFEHNKDYLAKTEGHLQQHNLTDFSELIYAPLVEMKLDQKDYLFYSCENKIAELAQSLPECNARILILVDGPPGSTCYMARYPAIPILLKYISQHNLHIIMDDYIREEEKQTAASWSKIFTERGIQHNKEMLKLEKVGFYWELNC